MSLPVVSYQTIINQLKRWILSNCYNFDTTVANLPAEFKAGYASSQRFAGNDTANSNYRVAISSAVPVFSSSVFETQLTEFMTKVNLSDKLSSNVVESEFFDLVLNLISFCSTKLNFASSQFNSNKYLIYNGNNTVYTFIYQISSLEKEKLIKADDYTNLLNQILLVSKQNIRTFTCKYTITLS